MKSSTFTTAFSLEGQHALITGGGSGLGLGMAGCLAAAGARVTLVGRRQTELARSASEIGETAGYLVHDITDLSGAGDLIDRAAEKLGPVSILVNNAGIHLKKPATETTDQEFQAVIQTHVFGAFALARESARRMQAAEISGSILFTASMASLIGIPLVVAYSAAKSAYGGMVRSLASEWSESGIRVNAIAPGWIQSPMLEQAMAGDPGRKSKILSRTPMKRMGEPDDIGWAAVYLCSPAAKFITGVVVPVDGGASIGF